MVGNKTQSRSKLCQVHLAGSKCDATASYFPQINSQVNIELMRGGRYLWSPTMIVLSTVENEMIEGQIGRRDQVFPQLSGTFAYTHLMPDIWSLYTSLFQYHQVSIFPHFILHIFTPLHSPIHLALDH